MKNLHRIGPIAMAAAILIASGCATTTFQSTWRAPDARPLRLTGSKVLAVFINNDSTIRHSAEDAMAREISTRGAVGVPAYSVLPESESRDADTAKAKAQELGFQGAIVQRIVGSQTQYTFEPDFWWGPHYHHFWSGYWGWGWGTIYEPGYLREDKIVKVETLVYSLTQDELVWAGVSRTMNPSEINGFIHELASATTREMTRAGLLEKSGSERPA